MKSNATDMVYKQLVARIGVSEAAQHSVSKTNCKTTSGRDDSTRKQPQRVVCVVALNKNEYSETFIRAHKENLPARINSLYVGASHNFCDDNGPLLEPAIRARLKRAILRRLLKVNPDEFEKQAFKQFLLQNKVDAVLAEFGPTATRIMDACQQIRIPLIAHFHGYDAYSRPTLERFGKHYGELFQNAAAIIAVSRDMVSQLLSLGAPSQKLHYNSCGVDLSVFQQGNPLNNPPTFIAVGRFVNKKAPHLTLLAFKKVVENYPEARLVMIGDGPLWEACFQMTKAMGLASVVELLGQQPHVEVAAAMHRGRAFVQHSIRTQSGDCEGTPVAVLEAGASSLPVVATRHAGIKEAVIDEQTGFLVDEGDIEGMAERMFRLAKDPPLATRLGRNAREWICQEYSMEKSINNLWRIIEAAIAKGSAPS